MTTVCIDESGNAAGDGPFLVCGVRIGRHAAVSRALAGVRRRWPFLPRVLHASELRQPAMLAWYWRCWSEGRELGRPPVLAQHGLNDADGRQWLVENGLTEDVVALDVHRARTTALGPTETFGRAVQALDGVVLARQLPVSTCRDGRLTGEQRAALRSWAAQTKLTTNAAVRALGTAIVGAIRHALFSCGGLVEAVATRDGPTTGADNDRYCAHLAVLLAEMATPGTTFRVQHHQPPGPHRLAPLPPWPPGTRGKTVHFRTHGEAGDVAADVVANCLYGAGGDLVNAQQRLHPVPVRLVLLGAS